MHLRIPTTLLILAAALPAAEPATLEQRLEDLDQEVKILKRKAEIAAEDAAAKAKTAASTVTAVVTANAKDGFQIRASDNSFHLKFGTLIALDSRQFVTDDTPSRTSTFLLRYFRPSFTATVSNIAELVLVPEFAGSTPSIDNGYIDVKLLPEVTIRAGKFVQPVGLERWHSAGALSFGERSLASNLTSARDLGVQASGEVAGGQLSWAIGIFNGAQDNNNALPTGETSTGAAKSNGTFSSGDGKDVAARLSAKPLAWSGSPWVENLELSLSGSWGDEDGATPPVYVSPAQQSLNSYRANVVVDGPRLRLNPQLKWYAGSFSLLGEYVISRQRFQAPGGASIASNHAWYVSLGWVVTGEDATWRGVTPAKPFDPAAGGWGALELLVRVHRLALDQKGVSSGRAQADGAAWTDPWLAPRSATAWGVAAQWYLNRNLKLVNAYERTDFRNGAGTNRATTTDRETEHVLLSRLQASF